ncbi:MAG: SPOR domain-containing protein [Marinicellaceae bacterium]
MASSICVAQNKDNETNIVCFATQNKWICAPEDQQNIANEKASKLLEKQTSELKSADVVIKPINMPKFNTQNSIVAKDDDKSKSNRNLVNKTTPTQTSKKSQDSSEVNYKEVSASNPYAKLWSHQLIGVSSSQGAINYVNQKQLNKDEVLILKTLRSDKDWWIVLYGLYKDKQTGLDNANNLPANIDPPWLRPLKNLQVKGFIEKY